MVFDWLKRKQTGLRNPLGLPDEILRLLQSDFEQLRVVDRHLPDLCLRYAVDGEGEEVLEALRQRNDCWNVLGLDVTRYGVCYPDERSRHRIELFGKLGNHYHSLFIRLAEVYSAATHNLAPLVYSAEVPVWLEVFLSEALRSNQTLTAETVERMLLATGAAPDIPVRVSFLGDMRTWQSQSAYRKYHLLEGFGDAILRHPDPVMEALQHPNWEQRVNALEILNAVRASIGPFAVQIVDLAVSSSANVRNATGHLLRRDLDKVVPLIREKAIRGKPDERLQAVTLLHSLCGTGANAFLESRRSEESSRRVLDEIERIVDDGKPRDSIHYELPPIAYSEPPKPLPESVLAEFRSILQEHNEWLFSQNEAARAHQQVITPTAVDAAVRALSSPGPAIADSSECLLPVLREDRPAFWKRVTQLAASQEMEISHLFRLAWVLCQLRVERRGAELIVGWHFNSLVRAFSQTHETKPELRDLAAFLSAIGRNPDLVGWEILHCFWSSLRWDDALTWPYFAECLHILERVFGLRTDGRDLQTYEEREARLRAYPVIRMFPEIPSSLFPRLWEIALSGAKTEAPLAMECLERLSDKEARLIESLKGGKAEARALAASWLARIGAVSAIPALRAALASEKQDSARVAIMNALGTLGVPLSEVMPVDDLMREAQAGLKKGIPDALSWFPFRLLPIARWAETGMGVPSEIMQWWVIQQFKLGGPEPGELLKRYCSLLRHEDRESLGRFVLEAWIDRDTTSVHTQQEAEMLARQVSQAHAAAMAAYMTQEELYRAELKARLDLCKFSAVKEKGILALTGACGGSYVVPAVERYLKRWYGIRAAQSKALIRMLGHVEDRSATQLLLSVSRRFRTKGIQDEATAAVSALAERKGWTVRELADRTIPTAGFDDGMEMVLEYGKRSFTARISPGLDIVLTDEKGSPVKSLPDARQGDDPEMVKASKQRLSSARKELKSIAKIQKERLYEDMCTERSWRFEDWETYLYGHPVVRHFCQSLIWSTTDDPCITFRPLDDGTLTDCDDSEVTVQPDALVRIAHAFNVPAEEVTAWVQHMTDYETNPLFDQFGKPVYRLHDERKDDLELGDFRGHLVEAFKLRSKATSLGYTRGENDDGAWFSTYVKRLQGIGIEVTIQFSGNELPEQNRTVALENIHFLRFSQGEERYTPGSPLPLREVPEVLLSECWNDLRIIAETGSGFDPDWEKKVN